jgi:hypothetical protein
MSLNDQPTGSEALEQAIDAFKRMPVPERPDDTAMLALLAGRQSEFTAPYKWRLFSRPAFQVATAAAIVIGVGAWLLWNPAAPLALADVIQATERHQLFRCTLELTAKDQNGSHSERITSYEQFQPYRLREEHHRLTTQGKIEPIHLLHIVDWTTNRYVMIYPTDKTAYIGNLTIKKNDWPRPMIESLREMQDDRTTTSGKDKLNGQDMIRYRNEKDGRSVTLWVDGSTKLPTRLESTLLHPDGTASYRFVYSDFEWDPKVPDRNELFSLMPPEGYAVVGEFESKDARTERRMEILQRRSFEQSVKDSQVIVVATALDSAPALPNRPGDRPEVLIRFKATRTLKGNLAEDSVTIRMPTAAVEFMGKEWILMLSPEYMAGKHQFAGCCNIKLEPEVRAILLNAKK